MRYLLDVNALVALGFLEHEFHERIGRWLLSLGKRTSYEILICAITELGFVRVLSRAPQYGLTVAQARTLLVRLKKQGKVPFWFIADDHDISRLPAWVKTGRQTTDGHLAELARAHIPCLRRWTNEYPLCSPFRASWPYGMYSRPRPILKRKSRRETLR